MSKESKDRPQQHAAQSNGVEALVSITKAALQYRGMDKPNLAEIGRVIDKASRLIRISDLDERLELENRAAVQVAKELGLIA